MRTFDALVIGAGPGGSTAALGLARAGCSVALVEKAAFPRVKVCGEFISAATWPLLVDLGAGGIAALAGPPVRRVGLMAGRTRLDAPMPQPCRGESWGRAVPREVLDPELLRLAAAAGATVMQPAQVEGFERSAGGFDVRLKARGAGPREVHAKLIVAANGSWERAPGTTGARAARPSDLLGFKTRFTNVRLASGLMPLLLFPGGYGGMVHLAGSEVSFSCCIRRDALQRARAARPGLSAGDALIDHARQSCAPLDEALAGATRAMPWLSAGPLRPGVRARFADGVFRVGNAAGEAHPLIAEGISMAVQSASLLCGHLREARALGPDAIRAAGERYARDWLRHFGPRIRASQLFAALTVPPHACRLSVALLALAPGALTLGAHLGGKGRIAHALGDSR